MADLLNTGISALTAMQRALATTSNNIANVNTDGYSRQRVEFATRMPELTGSGYIGTGVDASAVRRIFDGFVQNRVNSSTSTYQREQAYLELATQVDDLLADSEAGLSTGLQSFFDSVQQLANDPTSTANRQVMLTESEVLVDRFHYLDQRLNDLNDTVNSQLRGYVGEINNLADSIAKLNVEIVREYARGSDYPPLLKAAYPQEFYASYSAATYALCLTCHDRGAFEYARTSEATSFRNGSRNLHRVHVNKPDKGRVCKVCHGVHGADQPRLIMSKVPGFGQWDIPIKLTVTKSGGTCFVGCHKPKSYNRYKAVENN